MNDPSAKPAAAPAKDAPRETTGYEHLGLGLEQSPVQSQWGDAPADHFGYATDTERLARRGMEDWELVTKIPESQRRIPYWFIAVVVIVLLVAVGLGFPFWGQRPGVKVEWFNWGFVAAIFYVAGAGAFVYYMTNLYGSERAGRLDSDPKARKARAPRPDTPEGG
jgi:hypothetical protein